MKYEIYDYDYQLDRKTKKPKFNYYKVKIECKECSSNNRITFSERNQLLLASNNCMFCGNLLNIDYRKIDEVKRKELEKIEQIREKAKMDIDIEESFVIDEGKHEGDIVGTEVREKPYHYFDVVLTVDNIEKSDGNPLTVKAGFPLPATPTSSLGVFLKSMGFVVEANKPVKNVDKELIGKKVTYVTVNKTSERGTFANVVRDSIKEV